MEKMICPGCGAPIVPNNTQAFLVCEYCGTSAANPHYNESAAKEAATPSLDEACVATLIEMGRNENLANLDSDCFGTPLHGLDSIRMALTIPDAEQVYFVYAHSIILLGFSEGFALTDGGLYYKCDGGEGSKTWEAFITGAIACEDRGGRKQDGTLSIGTGLSIGVNSDKDSRLARFLVDFHNRMYQQHTGDTAPATWTVTSYDGHEAEENGSPSLLSTVLPVAGALLGGNLVRRNTIAKRSPAMHPTGHPTVARDRINHQTPASPLHTQPHQRPAGPARPSGGMNNHGGMGGPGGRGGMGNRGGMGGPGGRGGMGGPGRGRR